MGLIEVVAQHSKDSCLERTSSNRFCLLKIIEVYTCKIPKKHVYGSIHVPISIACRWRFSPACIWLQISSGLRKTELHLSLFNFQGKAELPGQHRFCPSGDWLAIQLRTLSRRAAEHRGLESSLAWQGFGEQADNLSTCRGGKFFLTLLRPMAGSKKSLSAVRWIYFQELFCIHCLIAFSSK